MKGMSVRIGVAVMLLALAGCAAGPGVRDSSDQFGSLYEGKSKTAFATERPPTSAKEANRRGDEALRQGDRDLALFNYVGALELGGSDADTLYKIGVIHDTRGNLGLAQLAYQIALKTTQDHAGALEGLGLNLLQQRKQDEAAKQLTRAVEIEPQRWRAHNGLGVIADLGKNYELAASHYAAALRIKPDLPMLHNNLGYSKYLAGDWDAAQRSLETALSRDPQYKRAWLNLGLVFTRRGNYNEALSAFRQVMDDAQASNNVGYLMMMEGDYDRAESFVSQAIALSPSYYANAHENLKRVQELRDM